MVLLNKIRDKVRNHLFLKQLFAYYIVPSGIFDSWFLSIKPSDEWVERTNLVLSCPDNDKIARVINAGNVEKGYQIMHNGIKILLGSYYGPEVSHMLLLNKGVHEPQEELVFKLVLDDLKSKNKDRYTMIELGSFWSFYSMWFQKELTHAHNYMVEPELFNIGCGKLNFKKNGFKGTFINALVSNRKTTHSKPNFVSVDSLIEDHTIEFVDIVHSDIQGHEFDMLTGSIRSITTNKIGYFFISTHSNEIHEKCLNFLTSHDCEILASANIDESYSFDGLIVAKNPLVPGIGKVEISLRR